MKSKIWGFILLVSALTFNMAQAVSVSDIDTIRTVSVVLYADAQAMMQFAQMLINARDANFTENILGSTQTISYTNAQKSGLIAEYANLKKKMQDDFALLP